MKCFCQIEHWTFCDFKSSSIRGHSCHKNSVVGCFSLKTGLANSTITLRLHVGIFGLVGVILCRNLLSNKDVSPGSKLQSLNIKCLTFRWYWSKIKSLFRLLYTEIFCSEGSRNFYSKASLQKFLYPSL